MANPWSIAAFTFTLTVNTPSNGTVTSSPGTINCGVTCVNTFKSGTDITLTAPPATNYNFDNWGGSCAASGATCILTMNTNDIVSASFSSQTQPAVTKVPR